jgi:hypothetical protein
MNVIHLDPTGISTGGGGSVDPAIAEEAAQRDIKNEARLTSCGLTLVDVEYRGVAGISGVTCRACLGKDSD